MASKQSNVSFVLFILGMALLMGGLLLVPNQLFGDDPLELPATQNCTGRCDLDQTTPCCVWDPMASGGLGDCINDLHNNVCKGGIPNIPGTNPCSGKGTGTVTCNACICSRVATTMNCECR